LGQLLVLSLPAVGLGCFGLFYAHSAQTPINQTLVLENVKIPQASASDSGVKVLVTVQYHPQSWYNRRFTTVPHFILGATKVIDASGKTRVTSMFLGGPVLIPAGGRMLPPSNDGSSCFLFSYDVYFSRVPKAAGTLRLLSSISADGNSVPVNVVIRR